MWLLWLRCVDRILVFLYYYAESQKPVHRSCVQSEQPKIPLKGHPVIIEM